MNDIKGYQSIPIYKAALDLVVIVDSVVKEFPKYHKYEIGSLLRRSTFEILNMVRKANYKDKRRDVLLVLCDKLEELKLLCNVGKELKVFSSFSKYVQLFEQVMNLTRQAEGWRRSFSSSKKPEFSK